MPGSWEPEVGQTEMDYQQEQNRLHIERQWW